MPAKLNLYTFLRIFLICGLLFAVVASCKEKPKKAITTEPITFNKEGELEIYRGETDSLLTRLDIEIAESDYEIQTGLMYREAMDASEAMLFLFPALEFPSFYMKNTLIPLDIIFIDDKLRVVNYKKNATPLDEAGIPSGLPVQYVLEVNAGLSASWNLQIGDRIVYTKE